MNEPKTKLEKAARDYILSLASRPAAHSFVESIFMAGAKWQLGKDMGVIDNVSHQSELQQGRLKELMVDEFKA